jgi:hypothetical protein
MIDHELTPDHLIAVKAQAEKMLPAHHVEVRQLISPSETLEIVAQRGGDIRRYGFTPNWDAEDPLKLPPIEEWS